MGMIDLYNGFHCEAIQREYPPSARVLFDTFIYQFNAAFWIDKLVFSERELTQMTGLKKTTLHEAKHFLTSRHILECRQVKGRTAYSLGPEMTKLLLKKRSPVETQPTTNRPPTDQQATSRRPPADRFSRLGSISSFNQCGKDIKTEDVKTFSPTASAARARDTQVLDDIIEYWEESRFGRLDFEMMSELKVLLDRHGAEALREAMKNAKFANGKPQGVSFAFFKKVLDNMLKAKGGERHGRTDTVERSAPAGGFNPILGYDPNSD